MASPIVIITGIESGFGFVLTCMILSLVLRRGRQLYHYMFAAFLLICAVWDLGVCLMMILNGNSEAQVILGRVAIYPCIVIPALVFHFANLYTGKVIRWAVVLIWVMTFSVYIFILAGVFYQIDGVYAYDWGNIFKVVPSIFDPMIFIFWFGINGWAIWLLVKGARKAASPLQKRHYAYIIIGFLVLTLAIVKAFVTLGVDAPVLLPLGMFLVDVFNAIIGIAIVKDRLFDITVIVKKSAIYSLLAALVIFVFSFSEHLLITYFGEYFGEKSETLHLISIGVGIMVMMPVKQKVEHAIDHYFARKQFVF